MLQDILFYPFAHSCCLLNDKLYYYKYTFYSGI